MNDRLFGTLQTPLKPIHYTGIDTSTVDVIVNSENRTISANIQPEVLDKIETNIQHLDVLKRRLDELRHEVDDLEKVVASVYFEIYQEIGTINQDTKNIKENIELIESIYAKETDVKTWIDDARIPQAELNTYAKVTQVEELAVKTAEELAKKVDTVLFEASSESMKESLENTTQTAESGLILANDAQEKIAVLEASIGPLPVDKTLKEEMYEYFSTKDEVAELKSYAENTYATKVTLDSYATHDWVMNKNYVDKETLINEDFASKSYVDTAIENLDLDSSQVDLSNYYTKSETYNRSEVYTKGEVDKIVESGGGTSNPDMLNYYTKVETDTAIVNSIKAIDFIESSLDLIS